MLQRTIAALTFGPIFLGVLFLCPPVYVGLMLCGITSIASCELLTAGGVAKKSPLYPAVAFSACAIPTGAVFVDMTLTIGVFSLVLLLLLFWLAIRWYDTPKEISFETISLCFFAGIVFPSFLSCLIPLKLMENGEFLALLPVGAAFATDSGAYFAGVTLGKHRGITRVSPNKSLEGYVGGILFSVFIFVLYGFLLQQFTQLSVSYLPLVVYAVVGGLITEQGDLSFSLIKRQKGIKDFGHLIPGHGGMLDRFDSMIFSAPTVLALVILFPAF